MRILIIGGTRFVGRAITQAALTHGHQVALLHRTAAPDLAFEGAEQLLSDRNADLSVLAGREFDATIDVCAYVPRHVAALATFLGVRGGHHVLISTVSVYADPPGPGADESAELLQLDDPTTEEVTGETYGGLKVLCEEAARSAYGEKHLTVVRPTYVVGPYDPTGRFTWWVQRIAQGGEVLAPGPKDSPMQVIDARDQGDWIVSLAEQQVAGTFTSASPQPPFGMADLLEATVEAVGPEGTSLTWVEPDWLTERGETYQSLPLWTDAPEWVMAMDPTRAYEAGLTPRPITETIADTWAWMQKEQPPLVEGWGITRAREEELLSAWHSR